MLIVISGLPGVGKTTVADLVGARLGAVRLSIDPVEDALLGAGFPQGWETGVAAYEAVRAMAELNLRTGRTVVVDAVNDSEPARDTWRRAADSADAELCSVVLTMSDTIGHASRLRERDRGFTHVTEPTWTEVAGREVAPWVDTLRTIDVSGMSGEQVAADVERYVVEFRFNN
ncbi:MULTISPECIES: AAA family ATPase [Microbacterium]|uniref:AAA family ATPase n=1 Tax=Microbacterium mcarthurae TaxID=3035918 RepID=A0ABW9GF83_9MICO|nr:AAA family ATPase [Microbacterium sp. ACRRU]MCG7415981.1 ATP-binding protein [Microbacterium sp. ACRRU]